MKFAKVKVLENPIFFFHGNHIFNHSKKELRGEEKKPSRFKILKSRFKDKQNFKTHLPVGDPDLHQFSFLFYLVR